MNHYRIELETGKKNNLSKTVYVKVETIIEAMEISKKFKGATLKSINPISFADYMKGVDLKYEARTRE